jgi:hypothetical protein
MTDIARLRELEAAATKAPWEVGGPYPGTSVIVCIDPGCGGPDAEPPAYDAVCILDQRIEGEPNKQARADAVIIAAARNALVEAAIPIEVLVWDIDRNGSKELAPSLQERFKTARALIRDVLGDGFCVEATAAFSRAEKLLGRKP